MQALSQLSYTPTILAPAFDFRNRIAWLRAKTASIEQISNSAQAVEYNFALEKC